MPPRRSTTSRDACGVSKALLYHYYVDKEHLLYDIAESYVDRLQRIVGEVRGEALPPAAAMRKLIARFMSEYGRRRRGTGCWCRTSGS